MARLIRRHASRRLGRRSRAERRRLSEGGGSARPEEPQAPAQDDDQNQAEKLDLDSLTDQEVDYAYNYLFFFYEAHGSLLLKEVELLGEIENYREMKTSLDLKIRTLKAATRSPGSDNVKRIRGAERRTEELQHIIDHLEQDLTNTRLEQVVAEEKYRWYARIVDDNVIADKEGLLFGLLGHVFRQGQ
ncbi:hypothetical protein C2845_PM07G30930 [Panicum miliaceum]|uniref:Uncharacterized protein n=1 Tax=Panicum miliaceum TaxID=4540 RepID=A0A3L6SR75_PANMI|nr:hypothetical protein C2845_PM07G30930 [Panicum miliaceum]